MESFNLKKLNKVEGKEQYHIEISNRFAVFENLDTEVAALRRADPLSKELCRLCKK
jgi:hypothetical protein